MHSHFVKLAKVMAVMRDIARNMPMPEIWSCSQYIYPGGL